MRTTPSLTTFGY